MIHVLSVILALSEFEVSAAMSSKSTLAQTGLVTLDSTRLGLCSKLDLLPGFSERMQAEEGDALSLFRDAFALATPPELTLADYAHIQPSLDIIVPHFRRALAQGEAGVNVLLHGVPGTGKSQFARVLASAIEAECFEVSNENEEGNPIDGEKRLCALRAAQRVLKAKRAILVFDECEDVFADGFSFFGIRSTADKRKGWINQMLEDNPLPCLWLSNFIEGMDPAFIRRYDVVLELPVPPKRQRERIITATCGDLIGAQAIGQLAQSEHLAPAIIARAARVVRGIREELPDAQVPGAIEHLVSGTLEAQGHAPVSVREGLALPSFYDPAYINADADLAALADGIARAGSARLCLYGPPGTGKSAFGRWLAERLDRPLNSRRVSDLVSPYVGMTERNLARAFRDAERERAVFLLDEVDSFLQDRRQAQHGWEVTAVNELLTQMEAYPGVFIAATNLMDDLDPAALRRFDLKVRFDYLRQDQAWPLFSRHAHSLGLICEQPAVAAASARPEYPHPRRLCRRRPAGPFPPAGRRRRAGRGPCRRMRFEGSCQTCPHRFLVI